MTKKEYLINELHTHHEYVDKKTIEAIFNAYNKRDWAVYDHPSERVKAEKDLEAEIEKITHPFGILNYPALEAVEAVRMGLTFDINKTSDFYHKNFHTLDEEYKG
jgi:hypothetical protein